MNDVKTPAVGKSPWGPEDQQGALNRMDAKSRGTIMARIDGSRVYDLSVDFFLGMPSFQAAGDPAYQIWLTHTPRGTVVDNLNGQGKRINSCCGYSGDVILMYTHTGTHIDSLNHFGYGRKIYNGFDADEHLVMLPGVLGKSEDDNLDLVELVDAEYPASVLAGGSGFAAEAGRVAHVAQRQVGLVDDLA